LEFHKPKLRIAELLLQQPQNRYPKVECPSTTPLDTAKRVKACGMRNWAGVRTRVSTQLRFVGNLVLRSGLSDPSPSGSCGASSPTLQRVTEQHVPHLEARKPSKALGRGRHDRRGSMETSRRRGATHQSQVATHAPGRLIIVVSTKMPRPLSLSRSRANFGPNAARQTWRAV
jgi:hypothetical protein